MNKDKSKKLKTLRVGAVAFSIACMLLAVLFLIRMFAQRNAQSNMSVESPERVSHRVLFLSSYNPLYFTYDAQASGLAESLYPNGTEYDVYYMDVKNYNSESDRRAFHDFLKSRLASTGRKYEAVLLGDDDALRFAMEYQDELFPGLPMVFFGINELRLAQQGQQNIAMTGFYEYGYLKDTLELAMRLMPDKKRFVALHDDSAAGKSDMEIFYTYAEDYPEYEFYDIDSAKLSEQEFIAELNALGDDVVLFYMTCYSDRDGNTYSMRSRTELVVSHTNVPIFRNYVGGEGEGILGGTYLDMQEQARMAGETLVALLNGADIRSYGLVLDTPSRTVFDSDLINAYGLNRQLLPENTIYVNQMESFREKYGPILPTLLFIALAVIALLVAANISVYISKVTNAELRSSRDSLQKSEEELRHKAEYDDFLNILNRRAATEYLRSHITTKDRYAIAMADIDGFKGINESYGHLIADTLLKKLSNSLKELADKNGWLMARYGGDEFMFLIPDAALFEDSEEVKHLMEVFRRPIPGGDGEISFFSSVGISNSDGASTSEQHIIFAENAMYEAKNRGGNRVFIYAAEMQERAREEQHIKEKLQEAFDNDGFYMLYQPQINSETKRVSGYEALVRMKEPGLYPGQFIPVAEKNGWIWKIGRITTKLVIQQLAAWRDEGYPLHPVSVNFSSSQMGDAHYIDYVEGLLHEYRIPAKYLEIEITEGVFLDKSTQADQLFTRFKEMGIRLLMDDFGTGYSSLGYLTYIPVDVIKLDKSLVDTYLVDGKDLFIKDVIQLMHDLDKEMIIEGVEEGWQFERLREFQADTIQGYYFSKPIPPDEAIIFQVKEG